MEPIRKFSCCTNRSPDIRQQIAAFTAAKTVSSKLRLVARPKLAVQII
jgi:hypothetical protein